MLAVPLIVLGLAVALVPAWRPWSTPTPARATASGPSLPDGVIGGRVVDADGDAVEAVRLVLLGPPPRYFTLSETRSDAAGAFSFPESKGARVRVLAEHPERGVVLSAELLLDETHPRHEVVLTLEPARAVKGRVTGEDGKPLAGATVVTDGPPWAARKDVSADDGSFALSLVPLGARSVRVASPGFRAATVTLATPVTGPEERVDVQLVHEKDVEGTVLDVDGQPIRASVHACEGNDAAHRTVSGTDGKFRLSRDLASCPLVALHDSYAPSDAITPAGEAVVLRLRPGGGISGVVVDESGSAVPAFFVGIESFTPASGGEFSVRSGPSKVVNDPGGAFVLEKLAPGSYVLSYGAEGRSAARSSAIDVTGGRVTTGVRLVLARGGTVEGQVFDEAKRSPIQGARVSFDSTTATRGESVAAATTDAEGRYRLENAPRGAFSLRVDRDGFNARIVAGLRVDTKATLVRDVGLTAAGDGGSKLEFAGIGATLMQTRDGLAFAAIFDAGPAEKAGLQQGDLLRKIDGEQAEGLSVADAVQRLRGEAGSAVRLSVVRAGQPLEIAVVRAIISR